MCAWMWLSASFQGRERLCLPSPYVSAPLWWAKGGYEGTGPSPTPFALLPQPPGLSLWSSGKNAKIYVNKSTTTNWFLVLCGRLTCSGEDCWRGGGFREAQLVSFALPALPGNPLSTALEMLRTLRWGVNKGKLRRVAASPPH